MARFDSLVHATRSGQWPAKAGVDASPTRLLREMDAAEVDRACLVAVSGLNENDDVQEIAAAHPTRFVPIASFNPSQFSGDREIRQAVARLRDEGFAGVKLHPRMHDYDATSWQTKAALNAAGDVGVPAFLCTLFRRPGHASVNAADTVDALVNAAPGTKIVLLHGGGTELLDLFELVRMHSNLLLDLSFTLLRYRGSSLDADIRFAVEHLDQRLVVGSDFPDYSPAEAFPHFVELTEDQEPAKVQRTIHDNLHALFASWSGFA